MYIQMCMWQICVYVFFPFRFYHTFIQTKKKFLADERFFTTKVPGVKPKFVVTGGVFIRSTVEPRSKEFLT